MPFEVLVKRLNKNAIIPNYMTPHASGVDLYAMDTHTLYPGKRCLVGTGLAIVIPDGYSGSIRPRSGLASKNGVTVLNAPGTLDRDFRHEVKVLLINCGEEPFSVCVGDRIAQMVFERIGRPVLKEVDELDETERKGGFGSTGV